MSTLKVQTRDASAKAPKLRKQGILPMALMRRDHSTSLIQGTEEDFRRALKAADGLGRVDVEIDGKKALKALVRQIEKDFRSPHITHAVLQEVSEHDTVTIDVAVLALGTPVAVTEGHGTMLSPTGHLKVKGMMSAIPDHFEVDVSGLNVGDNVSAHSIELPEGVSLVSSPDQMLFVVTHIKEVSLTPETATAEEAAGEEAPAAEAGAESEQSE